MAEPLEEISQKIKFSEFCQLCEKIKNSQSLPRKEKIFKDYLKHFNQLREALKKDCLKDDSFYCVLRLLLPKTDTNRQSYGLQITSLGRIYVKILGINSNGETAKKLQYNGDANVEKGDYAETVYSIMKPRSNDSASNFTLYQINLLLDLLARESRQNQEIELTKFIEQTSAMEQKWLIRILLKNLNLKMGEQKIFGMYHRKFIELYRKITDLKKVCSLIESSKDDAGLDALLTKIQPFQYVKPMLCEKLFITTLANIFENQTFYLETKMDGERFQMHLDNEVFKYISRNGIDYTKHFGSNNSSGNLSPMLAKLINASVKNIILDGEMMVWDKSNQKFRIKGEHYDVKHLQIGGNLRPCFVVYDILYLNGVEYLDRPYIERIDKIKSILTEKIGVLNICKRIQLSNVDSFLTQFNIALENNEEGVVIKQHSSTYKPGRRSKSGWYKLKPDYVNGLTTDFDMIVLGVFKDPAKGYIKSYLFGVIEKKNENLDWDETNNIICHSVGKIASGLSKVECDKINNNFGKYLKTTDCPYKLGKLKPDAWIEPKHSIIIQIRATELFLSQDFSTNYTLKFPRVESVREDKVWYECMDLKEYLQFEKENSNKVQKISKRHLVEEDLVNKRLKTTQSNPYISEFRINDVNRVTNIFDGITFCILSGSFDISIDALKEIVIKHGGSIVDNPLLDSSKCIVIAGNKTVQIKKIMKTKLYNIVSLDWLIRCFQFDKITQTDSLEPRLREIISSTAEMEEKLKLKFDQYGDSYTIHVDIPELKLLLSDLNKFDIPNLSKSELDLLYDEISSM